MSVFIASINSGSNGNCYYIGNDTEAVLIDAGVSCRETVKRLHRMGLKIDKVKAIFISHEHTDHIYGAEVLSGRYEIPVYITPRTLQNSRSKPPVHLVRHLAAYEPVEVSGITVTAFPKLHDAIDPHSFVIATEGITTGVFTDIGAPCEHVTKHFSLCHAAFLEANYDDEMLEKGRYPQHLKQRIRSEKGHLSNVQAQELFTHHKPSFMTHLFLSHLSKDNNHPDIATQAFTTFAGGTRVEVASRFVETAVYNIGGIAPIKQTKLVQGSLF